MTNRAPEAPLLVALVLAMAALLVGASVVEFVKGRGIVTDRNIEWARDARAGGMSWVNIGKALGCDGDTIRRAIDPEFAKKRAEQIRESARRLRRERYSRSGHAHHVVMAVKAPAHLLADRDRRLNAPRPIGAVLLGDPPPGQSALDKRRTL